MFYSMTARNAGLQIHDLGKFPNHYIDCFLLTHVLSVVALVQLVVVSVQQLLRSLAFYLYSVPKVKITSIYSVEKSTKMMCENLCCLHGIFGNVLFASFSYPQLKNQTLISIIVEVTSAFGTTGLSFGITGDLSIVGKITLRP